MAAGAVFYELGRREIIDALAHPLAPIFPFCPNPVPPAAGMARREKDNNQKNRFTKSKTLPPNNFSGHENPQGSVLAKCK